MKPMLILFGGLVAVVVIVLLSGGSPVEPGSNADVARPPTPSEVASDGVTLAQYQQLSDGLSYADAIIAIGAGTEMARSSLAGVTTVMYLWKGAGSPVSNMTATFQNEKLVSKAQFGLR